jgi:hypothetical protein
MYSIFAFFIKIPPGTLLCVFLLQYWVLWICESMHIGTLEATGIYRKLVPQRSAIWLHRASKPRLRKLPKLWKNSYIRSDKTHKWHQAYSSTDLHEISRLNLARVTPCVSKIKNVYTILQSAARFLFLVFLFETYKYRMYAIACMLQLLPSRRSGGCMHAAGWYGSG